MSVAITTLRPRGRLRRALLLAASTAACVLVAGAATPPAEGLSTQGTEVVSAPADRVEVAVALSAVGRTPEDAVQALEATGRELLGRLAAASPTVSGNPATPQVADLPATPVADGGSWSAVREIRAIVARDTAQPLLRELAALPGVKVRSVAPAHGDLDGLRRAAIERATAAAQARGDAAARGLGFVLGAVRDVTVKTEERYSEAMVDVEARVDIRYALTPATTRAEVLAIAAAARPASGSAAAPIAASAAPAAATGVAGASDADRAPQPLAVEVVAAVYDATGRGRFTTATGTVWREVVPAPADQRLRPGRRYRGTITLGIFSGYRMQLEGVPRILKVEPAEAKRP